MNALLRQMFDAAVASAQPSRVIASHLPAAPAGRLIVIGAGKASAAMAQAVEQHWPGPIEGLVVTRYGYAVPCERIEIVEAAHPVPDAAGLAGETRPRLARSELRMIATPQMALEAAAEVARAHGLTPHILGDAIEGEARDVGKVLAGLALQVAERGQPFKTPCVLLSGGETTVTVRGDGRGGRNVEFLLSLAVALNGHPRIHALAGDTDGVDGQEEIAGALLSPDTLARAWALGIKPRDSLANNDGHGFFEALGDGVVTGPTLTNVNDFRAIVIDGPLRT